jgi:carboxyl-terminal processing protease
MKNRVRKYILPFVIGGIAVMGLTAYKSVDEKYFEIAKNVDIFVTLFKEVNTYYVDEVSPNKMIKTGIDAMLESLDPYTNYIPEDEIEDYRTMTTGQYGGIGAIIGKRLGKNMILMPYEGYPAYKAGLKIGDEIVSIDGMETNEKTTTDISKLLKGQAGTIVRLVVKRYGQTDKLTVEIKREKIKVDNIPYYGLVDNEVGYLHLTDFTSGASKEMRDAIISMKEKGAKKLILDLRDNPGGLLNEAVNVANIFIPRDKEVVTTKGKVSEWNKTYNALNMPVDVDMPVAVLINSKSASASEIVAGVIQDYDRGVLVGNKTFGKGLVQATRPLSYNSQLKVTTAKYYIPSGRCIQAIDYSHRNTDGSVGKIPDSLMVAFKTKNGRPVFDGGGIAPDITVEKPILAQIAVSLVEKNLVFEYATQYCYKRDKIAPAKEFKISDKEYDDFVAWLKGKEYDYKTKVETSIEDLVSNAKKEKYYDDIKDQVESLRTKVYHNKEQDLFKFKSDVKELLENEIVSRYYFRKGIIEASFDSDHDIAEAVRILNDNSKYKSLLKLQ